MGICLLEAFFPRHSVENYRIISNTSFTSEQYDKSGHIHSHKSCVPRGILQVTVLAQRVRKMTSEADSGANRNGGSWAKTPEQDEIDV